MNSNRFVGLLAVVVAVVLGSVAVAAWGSAQRTGRIMIGDELTITSSSTAAGVFSAAGGINDSGSTSATFQVLSVKDNVAIVVGEERLTGAHGSITLHFEDRSSPANEPRQIATGPTRITAASGMYSDLKGLTLADRTVVDFANSRVTDILDSGK